MWHFANIRYTANDIDEQEAFTNDLAKPQIGVLYE